MGTSFLSLCNMSGIACASNSDHTIYRLSKVEPVAVAVSPGSPIPWAEIIDSYCLKGEIEHHDDFADYANDFAKYLQVYPGNDKWRNISADDLNIIFMGYGMNDLYPCIYDIYLEVDDAGKLVLGKSGLARISNYHLTNWNYIGNFENINTILFGITPKLHDMLEEKRLGAFEIYKNRLMDKFAGSKFEERVKTALDNYNAQQVIAEDISDAVNNVMNDVSTGLDSFSMEELVYACENLVNANIRLNHLKSGCNTPLSGVKELAVITRVEGLTWIKHSLFAI